MKYMQQILRKKKEVDSTTVFIKLNGTNCNMRCVYCYNHVSSNKEQHICCSSLDVCEFLSKYTKYKNTFIVFHGGEPLLTQPKIIREILDYIDNTFERNVHVQFQTNGTLINDEWIELFSHYSHMVSLSFSVDPDMELDLRVYPKEIDKSKVWDNILSCCKVIENVGIISVAHKHNANFFIPFIKKLLEMGIHSLTINKYQSNTHWNNDDHYLTEMEYVELLISIADYMISSKCYKNISIQPIQSLFSKNGSKICLYLFDPFKCSYFHTFFNKNNYSDFCDHVMDNSLPLMEDKCKICDIVDRCGGGCLLENKDCTFCNARHRLFEYIGGYKV